MKVVSRITSFLLVTVLILSLFSVLMNNENTPSTGSLSGIFKSSDSVEIIIENDSDFIDQGWIGNGTELDPFVLQNQALGVPGDYGYIQIHDTTSHFVIRNCQLLLMDVTFYDVSNGRIEDCIFTNSSIYLDSSLDCVIIDNEFSSSAYWVETIWLLRTSGCEIRENQFTNGFTGISLHESNDTIIDGNRFTNQVHGGISGEPVNTTLVNNVFVGTGYRMEFWVPRINDNPPTILNNTVNGKELGIFFGLVDVEIDGTQYGQIILGNCNETKIVGGTFINCGSGAQVISSTNCTIDSIRVSDCSWQGITAERSPRIRIVDCDINNCDESGIFMSQCPFYTIENCTLEDNIGGILPHIYSNNGTIVDCTIRRNKPVESEYFQAIAGLYLSNNATATGNTITENNVGIIIYGMNCLVVDNVITHNGYGIYMSELYRGYGEDSYLNRIYGNDIGWNSLGNAYDRPWGFNEWDDGVGLGNAWSDYYGIGYYEIARDAVDHYPRLLPEGGVPLFYIHLAVGIPSSIVIVLLVVVLIRRVKISLSESI